MTDDEQAAEDNTPWQAIGQTCGNRALMLTRDADSGYVAEATLTDLKEGALVCWDEPSEEEVQLLRELLYFPQLIGLLRQLAGAYPGFPDPRALREAQRLLTDFDEVWP